MTIQLKTKKIPNLRFPGFLGEWEEKKLGEVSKFWNGKAHEQAISENGKYVVVNSKFISRNGSVRKFSDSQASPLKKDDIAIVMSDIPGGKAIGKCFLVDAVDAYTLNQRIGGIKSKEIESSFLIRILNRNKYFLKFDNGVSQTNLRKDEILRCPVVFPALPEQQKIASFLGAVDEWIGNLKVQKESLEKYKKGMMQKIFSQEIRFKNNDGKNFPEWEEKKLGDVGKTYNGLTGKAGEDFGLGETFITYKQIFDSSEIDIQKFALVKIGAKEKQSKARFGDILFTTSSETPLEVGFASVLLDKNSSPYLNSFSFGIRPNSLSELDPNFSKFFFRSSLFRKEAVKLAQGSTRYNISKIGFMKIKILLPLILEQQKIAEFLTSIDNLIESKQQQIAQAELWKKGLMQGLFV
jgi:type I restriction enzyme S subunit